MTPETITSTTNMKPNMKYMSLRASASALAFSASASVFSPVTLRRASSAVCEGKRVSMNFSIWERSV